MRPGISVAGYRGKKEMVTTTNPYQSPKPFKAVRTNGTGGQTGRVQLFNRGRPASSATSA